MQTHIHRTIQWWGGGILAAFIVVCIAWFSREESPLLWDAGSFYLAAADYNITQDRPHLPGYYLHIYAVRFSRIFFSPGSAGVALSILWAAVAVLLLHRVLIRYYTPKTALISALLFATNPMLLFFASLSETYTFDAFFGIALFACFTIRHRTSFLRWELLSLPLMAFALGYRATSVFLVAPLAAVLWWRYYQSNEKTVVAKQFALSLFIAIAVMLLWLIPMMNDCGGVASYIALYSTHNPVMKSSIIQNAVTMMSYSLYAGTALVVLWIAGLKVPLSNDPPLLPRIPLLLWLWIPLILFVIGFYGKGYALLCIPAACLLLHPVVARRLWLAGVLIVLQCMAYGF
ncbi:MAG: glycosyltransferase family 39 protein, partial [Candidatus Kapabacteria bacterium]|nr:glycosyltransferase family 39 protein [Candidatus Kapabacteria bacterium]